MAFAASDGKKFTNRPPMMAHERSMKRGLAGKTDPLGQPAGQDALPGGGEDTESPEQIAQAHGPATEVGMTHDHEAGMHHVHSMHPDGHEHHSDHGSAEEAHDHGKGLACGGGEMEHEGGDEPEYE